QVGQPVAVGVQRRVQRIKWVEPMIVFPGVGQAVAVAVEGQGLRAGGRGGGRPVGGVIAVFVVGDALEGEAGGVGQGRPRRGVEVVHVFDEDIRHVVGVGGVGSAQFDVVVAVGEFAAVGPNDGGADRDVVFGAERGERGRIVQ